VPPSCPALPVKAIRTVERLARYTCEGLPIRGRATLDYWKNERDAFQLLSASWRSPQLGALGSLLAHWTLTPKEPALVSLPTGTGKTGVALAAPFLVPCPPRRVLVMVPSTSLREQTADNFRSMRLLREARALSRWHEPSRIRVDTVEGMGTVWDDLLASDVVVAIPQSISPASEAGISVPPADMFDLVIVDEAHHLPAATWRAVLDHLEYSNAVFLTATPFRLDRKPVPGTRTFYFPLRQAIAERFYKPIRPIILPLPAPYDVRARDRVITAEVVRLMATEEHATSALLVRAQNVARATDLAQRYQRAGLDVEVLTSRLSESHQLGVIRRLQSGELRAVAVVGMLGEGFDLPRLRLVAYHDKHKSIPATVQLIGRLARVSEAFPQESVLVTVNDSDVYPELKGVVRSLYQEDADWATVLPGLVDAEVMAEASNRAYIESLHEREGDIDPGDLSPMPRPIVYEIDQPGWRPLGTDHHLPSSMRQGEVLSGALVLMVVATADASLLAVVTRRRGVPPWSADLTLESVQYGLSVVSYRPAPRTDLPSLLFVDADDPRLGNALLAALEVPDVRRVVSSERVDGYLRSLRRISVSSIGMRNILAGTRGTTYKTRAGSRTDTDLLLAETAQTSLGHLMMQIATEDGSTTVGAAFEKGRIWQRRYKSFLEYSDWITELAELLWFPRAGAASDLLPQIARGRALRAWPEAVPFAVEPHAATVVGGYELFDADAPLGPFEDFELHVGTDPITSRDLQRHTDVSLPVVGVMHDRQAQTSSLCWEASFAPNGNIAPRGADLTVRRGYGVIGPLAEFLEHYPPLIYFINGQATQGHELFDVQGGSSPQCDPRDIVAYDWEAAGVDIASETRTKAAGGNAGISIHEGLEEYLLAQPKVERWRWIICNDGSGEIADYLVIEWTRRRPVRLSLWHAKAAGGSPGLRVDDFQVVTAQALRSRSRFNDPGLWDDLRERMMGRTSPRATVVRGSDSVLRLLLLLGERRRNGARHTGNWTEARPLVHGEIAVVQPGLSCSQFLGAMSSPTGTTASSLNQLFAVLADTVAVTGNRAIILGST